MLLHQGGFQTTPPSPVDINGCAGEMAGTDVADIVGKLDNAVDLVISGHTHSAYNCKLPNATGRKIPVTSANAFGRVLTDIDLTLDTTSGDVVDVVAVNRVVDRSAPVCAVAAPPNVSSHFQLSGLIAGHHSVGAAENATLQAGLE